MVKKGKRGGGDGMKNSEQSTVNSEQLAVKSEKPYFNTLSQ